MPAHPIRSFLWVLPFLALCGESHARPEGFSIDTRKGVLEYIRDDRNNFTVQQSADGKLSVSVDLFQF